MRARILFLVSLLIILPGCTTSQVRSVEAPSFKLSFVVNRLYDKVATFKMFYRSDPGGLENRARVAGIDLGVARKIHDATQPSDIISKARRWLSSVKLVNKLVEDRFNEEGQAIEASKEDLWVQWKDLVPLFSKVVVETTESPWVHSHYICFVSAMFPGTTTWRWNMVSVKFNYGPEYRRMSIAKEILLSDVFQLLRKRYPRSEISDWQVWAFSEITPDFVLEDQRLKAYWPNVPAAWTDSDYPQLPRLEKSLKELFDRRTSYVDYEDKAAPVLKGFQPFLSSWLGVSLGNLQGTDSYQQLAKEMNLTSAAALVVGVCKGSPADGAGLMTGDFVTAFGSTPIKDAAQFTRVIRSADLGMRTSLTLLRQGKLMRLSVTIGEQDVRDTTGQKFWPGFTVRKVSEKAEASGNVEGVAVATITGEKSPAAVAGLKPGDLITAANGIRVRTLKDFYKALNANGGRSASLMITREGKEITLEL